MAIITLNNNSLSSVTALPAGVGGKVLQVVTATDTTTRTIFSTTFVTGSNALSVSITPSSTSSKIFVSSTFATGKTGADYEIYATLYRDSTNLGNGDNGLYRGYDDLSYHREGASISYLDSPNSTSALVYQIYCKTSSGYISLNVNGTMGTITAFEIAG